MKQTIRIGDSLSGKLHDEISSDLKGYVTVQVKNKKTGEIEHQENHNLIVYGGREWLLRRMFGSAISNNNYAQNSIIKWVGFGCGGGEAGNPLQAGTTFGHDVDLYEPCRIRFSDDSVTDAITKNYASRILPNGSIVPGYYKKISNITIKEDHANPYIENNIRKFPKLIAELRIELSSDDCNGENYTEGGSLVSYQDINEVALFISDSTVDDPGKQDEEDQVYLDVVSGDITQPSVYTNKIHYSPNISVACKADATETQKWTATTNSENAYLLYYKKSESEDSWTPIVENYQSINLCKDETLEIYRDATTKKLSYKKNGVSITIEGWDKVVDIEDVSFKLNSVGKFKLQYKNALSNSDNHKVECELQYRNYSSEIWKTLEVYTFEADDSTTIHTLELACHNPTNPDINVITNFRVRQTINATQSIHIKSIEKDETSYNLKCFVSKEDIKKISLNNFIYTETDTAAGNTISRSAPLTIIEVFDPEIDKPDTASLYQPYFVIERQESKTHTYDEPGLAAWCYAPSKASPYTMFSRVTLSSIRKTVDRELLLIWRIYC